MHPCPTLFLVVNERLLTGTELVCHACVLTAIGAGGRLLAQCVVEPSERCAYCNADGEDCTAILERECQELGCEET